MVAVEFLFAAVVIGAVPFGLARLGPEVIGPARWPMVRAAISAAAAALAIGTFIAPGAVAAALAAPWLVLTGLIAAASIPGFIRHDRQWRPGRRLAVLVALGFLAFGAANALSFAAGLAPLGFSPTVVLLTAVHFHAAGFVLMTAGILAFDRRPTVGGAAGIAALAVGTVVTAAGFVGVPVAATVGALAVVSGGLLVGWTTLRTAAELNGAAARWLARVAGAALFVSMPIAAGWVVGNLIGIPQLDLDVMIRTHGVLNALAVCVPVMGAWALDARTRDSRRLGVRSSPA
jgi:hypothetical protein